MQTKATQTVILATARKLDHRDRITAIRASDVDMLITDCQDEGKLSVIRDAGIHVIVAKPQALSLATFRNYSL